MAKTIAIDVNDVLRDYTRQFIKYYQQGVDEDFEIEYDDVTDFDFMNIFPFVGSDGYQDINKYYQFKYEDYAYELFARADVTERTLSFKFNLWVQNTLRSFDEDVNPNVIIVSPFEMNLSIQSTLSFLSRIGVRTREFYFPTDSMTIWDRADILITANPNLIENRPEGKIAIKINTPYNKDAKADYEFDSITEVIDNSIVENIITKIEES